MQHLFAKGSPYQSQGLTILQLMALLAVIGLAVAGLLHYWPI